MKFLDENNAYLDCANDDINTTNANGKMIARLLTTVSHDLIFISFAFNTEFY